MQNFYNKKQMMPGLLCIAKSVLLQITFITLWSVQLAAQNYTVNSNGDTHAASPATSPLDAGGQITLRSAMEASTQIAGTHIITIPNSIGATINLTLGQMTVGNASVGNNITVNGPGMNLLTINQTTDNRVFSTGTGAVTFLLQDITLNFSGPGTTPYSGGGGAIIAGGAGAATTLSNVTISNFNMQVGNGGAISASSSLANHSLTITNCFFTNNKCGGAGGAVSFNSQGGTATISGCTFSGNHTGPVGANTGGDGGALSTTGGGNGGTYTVEKNTFLNNQVENTTGHAGAVINTNGTLTLRYNRFIGNTCANTSFPPLANIIAQTGGSTVNTTIADNNWWGVNTGPGANDAVALAAGGTMTLTKWLQLKATASPTPICPTNVLLGNTSTVTASFLTNSENESISLSNLSRVIGLPVSFSAVLGNLSAAQTTIQSNGTATVLFTSNGTPGNGSVNAVVDNVPDNDATAKASIFINTPASISDQPDNTTVCTGTTATFTVTAAGVPAPTYQWRKGTTALSDGATGSGSTIAGATTATLTINNAGSADEAADYNVVVSNSCGTATSNNVSLTIVFPPTVNAPTVTQPTCAVPTGTIVVNASGSGTLEYSLNGGSWQTSNEFSGLAPVNYNISVRLQIAPACETSYIGNPVVIDAPPSSPVVDAPTVTQPACTTPTGTIVVNASGSGTLEYSLNGGSWQTSNTFSGLAPGNYNISVRLQSNTTCITNYSGNPVVIDAVPTPPVVSAPTVTQPVCAVPTGAIVVNASGSGTLEYSLNGGSWQTSNTFSGLAPGNYNISVRLQSTPDCETTYSGNPVVIDAVPSAPVVNAPTVTQPTCAVPTGTTVVNASGSGTLEYSLNGGSWQTSNTFSGLAPGNYNISVRSQSTPDCETSYSGNPVVIDAVPSAPVVNAPTVTQPTCAVPTGTIVVNASGSGTLEYSLNGGSWQTSNTFSGLAPGNYNIAVRSQADPTCVTNYSGNPVVLIAATGCTVPPIITCPANISTTAAANQCSKSVSFTVTATGVPSPTVVCKIGSTVITSPHTFPVGTTTVNCTATNDAGTDNCSFTVTVTDNQPPVINTVTNPVVLLWPPNHKYQKINVSQCVTSVTDNCNNIAVGNVVITHVTSDEAEDAAGKADGTTTVDMKIAANCKSVDLRRERMDGGDGRVYTIHFKVTDVNGNTATATSKVVAPPNQGGTAAVDNGPVYTEVGPCYIATRSASSHLLTKNTEINGYMMAQNYPNPFSTSTVIRFGLLKDAQVNLAVYNSLGQKVAQLEEGRMSAGYHQATFDASKLAAGIYLYRLQAVDADGKPFVLNKKMIVAK